MLRFHVLATDDAEEFLLSFKVSQKVATSALSQLVPDFLLLHAGVLDCVSVRVEDQWRCGGGGEELTGVSVSDPTLIDPHLPSVSLNQLGWVALAIVG